jgi:hypothetical protein
MSKIKKRGKTNTVKAGTTGKKCGNCIFYVANKDKRGIGNCFEINSEVKLKQSPKCKGKFFKAIVHKKDNGENIGQSP